MKHRRAISIVELLLVMSACSVVLSLTGVLLHRAMIVQIQSRWRTHAENTSLRLANQFRSDVYAAREARTENVHHDAGIFLHLTTGDDRTIEYVRENGSVLRLESGGARPPRRELYDFPPAAQLTIERIETPPRLALTVTLQANHQPHPKDVALNANLIPVSLHTEATIGRDLQLRVLPTNTEAPR